MNKTETEVKSDNIILLYSAQDKKAWILNVPIEAIKQFAGREEDDVLTAIQRNITEMSWELMESASSTTGFTGEMLGNLMVHLRLMHDITRDAVPDKLLAELIKLSFEKGDLSKRFQPQEPIIKINS